MTKKPQSSFFQEIEYSEFSVNSWILFEISVIMLTIPHCMDISIIKGLVENHLIFLHAPIKKKRKKFQ